MGSLEEHWNDIRGFYETHCPLGSPSLYKPSCRNEVVYWREELRCFPLSGAADNARLGDYSPSNSLIALTAPCDGRHYTPLFDSLAAIGLLDESKAILELPLPTYIRPDGERIAAYKELAQGLFDAGWKFLVDEHGGPVPASLSASEWLEPFAGPFSTWGVKKLPEGGGEELLVRLSSIRIYWLMRSFLVSIGNATFPYIDSFDMRIEKLRWFEALTLGMFDVPAWYSEKSICRYSSLYVPEELAPYVPEHMRAVEEIGWAYREQIDREVAYGRASEIFPRDKAMVVEPTPRLLQDMSERLGLEDRLGAVFQGVPAQDAFA